MTTGNQQFLDRGSRAYAGYRRRFEQAAHDPIPDGKTGPWLREPHRKDGDTLVYDERCAACISTKLSL